MYSDLLDVLGNQSSSSSGERRGESDKHVAVEFKAGKMKMELQENGKYWVSPDTRRGQVQLVWENELKWEWIDRRDKSVVVDTHKIEPGGSFERVDTVGDVDRVYLWTSPSKEYEMFWLQDLASDGDDVLVATVNQYLTNPADAAPEASTSQVDALSNILENLNMPAAQASGGEAGTGTLTLADLQGAMAGLQTGGSAAVPLSEVVTPTAISALLEDEAVKTKLLALLPEEQQSLEFLEENLRSPQVQQTLRALTSALLPDDANSMEGYHSVIANFQLDPNDGQASLGKGNPIQAFLDCILASVKKEEGEGGDSSSQKEEGTKEDAMEE